YVVVPLGAQELIGVVWGEGSGEVGHNRLKPLIEVLDAPPMPEVLRRFVDWIAGYTVSPAGSVLRLAIRAPGALEPARMRTAYVLAERSEERRVGKECSTRWGAELGREKQGRTQKG